MRIRLRTILLALVIGCLVGSPIGCGAYYYGQYHKVEAARAIERMDLEGLRARVRAFEYRTSPIISASSRSI